MPTLEELQQDTASLEHEIGLLQRKKADLLKEIEKAGKRDPLSTSFNQLKALMKSKAKKKGQPPSPVRANKKRKVGNEEVVIPNPVRHEYFDRSISKYFTSEDDEENESSQSVEQTKNKSLSTLQKSENVLVENIYRMFGITTFPVKKPNSNSKSLELLGIRIEIFNQTELVYETPHYLILQKNPKNSKWIVYKHTIPNFVQVKKIAELKYDNLSEVYLYDFVREIRDILNNVALKHQIIDKMVTDLSRNIKNLEKDIPMEILKFDLKIPNQAFSSVVINLDLNSVLSCHIERGFSESEKLRINNVLKGDVRSFPARLQDVIYSISNCDNN